VLHYENPLYFTVYEYALQISPWDVLVTNYEAYIPWFLPLDPLDHMISYSNNVCTILHYERTLWF